MVALLAPNRYRTKPLEQHLVCLREHIALCKRRDGRLTAIISFVQQCNRELRERWLLDLHHLRVLYRQQANTCRFAISPIHWIPDEILGEIFTYCLPLNHRFSRTVAPLSQLRVCVLWRHVTLSTHSLWSTLTFWSPPSNVDLMCYPPRFLHTWLLHSGEHSLDLFFTRGLKYNHLKLLVELVLLAHYSRCRHLDIHLTRETALALVNFVVLPPRSLARLETLVLENLDEADFALENAGPAITAFHDSPRLQKLTTNALDFTFSIDEITSVPTFDRSVLPWPKLTHLMITDFIRVDVLVVTLAECTALEFLRVSLELEVDDEFRGMDQWLPTQPVVLPHLSKLYISLSDGLSIPHLLEAFRFPALQQLYFRRSESQGFTTEPDAFSWTSSRTFLLQLQNLQKLSLVGRVGPIREIVALLQSTPLVSDLLLDVWTEYQALIPILFPSPDPLSSNDLHLQPLCRLQQLTFRLERTDFPFPSNCIRDYIESPQHNCSLTHLTIICGRAVSPRRMDEMHEHLEYLPVETFLGLRSGPIVKSTRYRTDGHLIDNKRTNRDYTMVDRLTVKPYVSC